MIDQTPDNASLAALELFHRAYREFNSRADRILEERGLGRSHHRILYLVGRNPRVAVNTLFGILGVSKQALNAPLRQLIEMDLIAVGIAAHDRRVKELTLTAEGARLEAQLTGIQLAQLAEAFAAAGPEATNGWRTVMQEFARTL